MCSLLIKSTETMSATHNALTSQIHWQAHVEACKRAGVSKAQYCRDTGLVYHCFIYWHAKFSEQKTATSAPQLHTSKFIPVSLSQPELSGDLQIKLPNGVLISGINEQSLNLIAPLIDQL